MIAQAVCVYCRRKPVADAWRPFCSERCRMADLGRWLGGEYRVPGSPSRPESVADAPGNADDAPDDPEDRR